MNLDFRERILEEVLVSIPQSGFGAFELPAPPRRELAPLPLFQSLSRDSGRLNPSLTLPATEPSLIQFQSLSRDSGRLNPAWPVAAIEAVAAFQSLSRDSGRLNFPATNKREPGNKPVSIPQSGFGAFELLPGIGLVPALVLVSIPQSGFGAFEPGLLEDTAEAVVVVSIPQSGFGAFEPRT